MKKQNVNVLLLTVLSVATLLVSVIGASFAYFTATATSEDAETVVVGAGKLTIHYQNDTKNIEPIEALNVLPSTSGEPYAVKEFTITGNNSLENTHMPYTLHLVMTKNEFENNMIEYKLSSTGSNGTLVPAQTQLKGINTGAHTVNFGEGKFTGQVTDAVHTYVLSLYFNDNEEDQDANKGKEFAAYVDVKVKAVETIN